MKDQEGKPNQDGEQGSDEPPATVESRKAPESDMVSTPKSVRGQITGLLLLLPVFGLLFAITHFGPNLANALTGTIKKAFGGEAETSSADLVVAGEEQEISDQDEPVEEKKSEAAADSSAVEVVPQPSEQAGAGISDATASASEVAAPPEMNEDYETFLRAQLQAALAEREAANTEVKVQYLDFTDDRQRLMAAFKVTPKEGAPRLGEYLFSWNEFRQYVSTNHAEPVDRIVLRTRHFQAD